MTTNPHPNAAALQDALLEWYALHRRDLPWRRTSDPYAILVSEVMLQQTQVDRVIPRYRQFLERFPTFQALAQASRAEVIRAWSPLGYNLRAVRLQEIARQVVEQHGGQLPGSIEALRRLKGLGPYTAAAVACFAFGQDTAVVDTNVRRVLGRVLGGVEGLPEQDLWRQAEALVPEGRAPDWNQAVMDMGATLCLSRKPRCLLCPLRPHCRSAPALQGGGRAEPALLKVAEARVHYRPAPQPRFAGSRRYYRGRIVEALRAAGEGTWLALEELGPAVKSGFAPEDLPWLLELAQDLARDGLLRLEQADAPGQARASLP